MTPLSVSVGVEGDALNVDWGGGGVEVVNKETQRETEESFGSASLQAPSYVR